MKKLNSHRKPPLPRAEKTRTGDSAKVRRPHLTTVYPRTRLFRALGNAHKQHCIVWVTGPPGAGKTTLANSYVAARGLPCLWYQIDDGDHDIASFFHYFSQAVQAATPRQRKPLPRLTPEHLPTLGEFARRYFHLVFERFSRHSLWVFDNYHALPIDSPLHEVLRDGLNGLPPSVRALFLSRNDPPPVLARLQIHNHLTLLDAQALKLTREEAAGLARRLGHRRPRNDAIHDIHAQADGWAAGVVLLLESERREPGAAAFAAPRALFDYFAGEILHHMEADTRRILMECALLPTMTAAAVVQLTGAVTGASVLADLARRNYFTVRCAHTAAAYQFHALFRDFLVRELRASYPDHHLRALQRRAASLLEAEDRVEDAVGVLREARAWEELARVIVNAAPALAAQARLETLASWIAPLPAEIVSTNAWLLHWLAQCRMMTNPTEASELSGKAFALFDQGNDAFGLYLSWSSVVSAHAADWLSFTDLDRWLGIFDLLRQRHPAFPTPEAEARITFSMLMIMTNRPTARPDIAVWLERASALVQTLTDVNLRFLVGAPLALYYSWVGDMRGMTRVVSTLEPLRTHHDIAPIVDIPWRMVLALYHWILAGKPEKTIEITDEAIREMETTGMRNTHLFMLVQGVYGSLVAGDRKGAEAYIARMQGSGPAFVATYHHAATLTAICDSHPQQALEHSEQLLAPVDKLGGRFQSALTHMDHAWLLYQLGQPVEALDHLNRCRTIGRGMQSRLLEYFCLTIEASASIIQGQPDVAAQRLGAALALDREMGGVVAPFRPAREWTRLYALALDHGIEVDHVRAMIRKRRLVPDTPPLEIENWPWTYRFYTLGRFGVVRDDKAVSLSGRSQKKPIELLKTLIALGGREVAQQKLIEILWPDAEGDAAQHTFETTLYRLRRFLGKEDPILLKDGRLSLDTRRCWVDCWAFERLLSQIDDCLRSTSTDGIEPLTNKLFGLYRGPFLDREEELPAAVFVRERLRSRFLRILQDCGHCYEANQTWEKAIGCYLQGLEVEPLTEAFYQKLMLAYRSLGRRAEGLATYERCKRTLHTLLGVAPSPESESLRQSLEVSGPE